MLNQKKEDPDLFIKEIFSMLQKEIPFQVGWFFSVAPNSLKRAENSLQAWGVKPYQIETGPPFLDEELFPSVDDLMKKTSLALRGEEWWSQSQFVEHALYREVLKPEGLFHAYISLLCTSQGKCIGYLVLWKKKKQGHFSDKDCTLLSHLRAKITRVLQDEPKNRDLRLESETASISQEARLFNPIEKVSGIGEEELYSLIRRRAQPGILILNQEGSILFLNHDASSFLESLAGKSDVSDRSKTGPTSMKWGESTGNDLEVKRPSSQVLLPEIVYQLFISFSRTTTSKDRDTDGEIPTMNRICIHDGIVYLLRALLLKQQPPAENHPHFMILVERVSQGVRVDQIDLTARLTPRENEVVHLLLEGKTNKEIAVCINIGEYTVKDHIKRVMKKLNVTTRAGIVAKVLQHHFPASPPV